MRTWVFAVIAFFSLFAVTTVRAQDEEPLSNGFTITETEIQEYRTATKNCDTPSLECLVRNVSRFTAIEWLNEGIGGNGFLGGDLPEPGVTLENNTGDGKQVAKSGGAITTLGYFIGSMYSKPPAQTSVYVADLMNSTGFIEPAYAQGIGFAALDPILDLWKKFRNVSYFFFIILFIAIGFMIMFRQKIGGQAAVTVQQAIPSIITSLVLVTFSYAIAGFIIDLMYIFMYLIIGVFAGTLTTFRGSAEEIIGLNIFQLIGMLVSRVTINDGFTQNAALAEQIVSNFSGAENVLTDALGWGGGLVISLVLVVAVLISGFKLFLELLKSYATVIFSVVTAPIILMFGALPGRNVFGGWIKGLIGNLIAFPTVLLMLIIFIEFSPSDSNSTGGFIPPFLVGGGQGSLAGPLLGFAVILALPEIVKKMKDTFGASDGFGMMLAGWATNRFKEGEVGIPVATGLGGAVGGVAKSGIAAYGKKSFGSWLRNDLLRGTDLEDGKGPRGGLFTGAQRGWDRGMSIRKTIDQIQEGRLFDPQNTEKLLSQLVEGQRASGDKAPKVNKRVKDQN